LFDSSLGAHGRQTDAEMRAWRTLRDNFDAAPVGEHEFACDRQT
jgi:hypothetical protein